MHQHEAECILQWDVSGYKAFRMPGVDHKWHADATAVPLTFCVLVSGSGLRIAYEALQNVVATAPQSAATSGKYSPDQDFFFSWAKVCSQGRRQGMDSEAGGSIRSIRGMAEVQWAMPQRT